MKKQIMRLEIALELEQMLRILFLSFIMSLFFKVKCLYC